eukprot:TRINITY_DN2693_c0_g1_i2.p1 TRINITY_DN2693_c0_g1~~TRINITY_DN2693_c0_g1_i2.p1  ORF type:complete len:445 (-),score=140.08 TRINITY_DN2693_c0_g1_i2:57-1391(-)
MLIDDVNKLVEMTDQWVKETKSLLRKTDRFVREFRMVIHYQINGQKKPKKNQVAKVKSKEVSRFLLQTETEDNLEDYISNYAMDDDYLANVLSVYGIESSNASNVVEHVFDENMAVIDPFDDELNERLMGNLPDLPDIDPLLMETGIENFENDLPDLPGLDEHDEIPQRLMAGADYEFQPEINFSSEHVDQDEQERMGISMISKLLNKEKEIEVEKRSVISEKRKSKGKKYLGHDRVMTISMKRYIEDKYRPNHNESKRAPLLEEPLEHLHRMLIASSSKKIGDEIFEKIKKNISLMEQGNIEIEIEDVAANDINMQTGNEEVDYVMEEIGLPELPELPDTSELPDLPDLPELPEIEELVEDNVDEILVNDTMNEETNNKTSIVMGFLLQLIDDKPVEFYQYLHKQKVDKNTAANSFLNLLKMKSEGIINIEQSDKGRILVAKA